MKMNRKLLFFAFTLSILNSAGLKSQNNVGIGTNTPNASSLLELFAKDKGVLVPRMTTVQRLAIVLPAEGLLVYDTNFECFYYYNPIISNWVSLCSSGVSGATGPTGSA